MTRVMHFIFQAGERYPMLLDGDGMPDYWVTLYVTETLGLAKTNIYQAHFEISII
jgi:hypothetical protein